MCSCVDKINSEYIVERVMRVTEKGKERKNNHNSGPVGSEAEVFPANVTWLSPGAAVPLPTSNTDGKHCHTGLVNVPDAVPLNATRHDLVLGSSPADSSKKGVNIKQRPPQLPRKLCQHESLSPSGAVGRQWPPRAEWLFPARWCPVEISARSNPYIVGF